MPIHPRLLDNSEESQRAQWLAKAIMHEAKEKLTWLMWGTLGVDLHRAPFPMTPEIADEMVRWCFGAGWPYASWHARERQTWLVLAREADTVAETLERFWQLELEAFERPGDVDFHTLTIAMQPKLIQNDDWQRVREKVFAPIASPGRHWSEVTFDRMVGNEGTAGVYRWRIDLLHD